MEGHFHKELMVRILSVFSTKKQNIVNEKLGLFHNAAENLRQDSLILKLPVA